MKVNERGLSALEVLLIVALIVVAILTVVQLVINFDTASMNVKMASGIQAAPPKLAEVQLGCHQLGTITIGGSGRGVIIDTNQSRYVCMSGALNGQSAYVVLDLPDGYEPVTDSGFLSQGMERGLHRYVWCFLNKDNTESVSLTVPLLVPPTRPVTTVRFWVYPIAENETCSGWLDAPPALIQIRIPVQPQVSTQDAGDGDSHGRDAK